jgi:hypothetical protein
VQDRDEHLLRGRLMLLVAKACEIVEQSFKSAGSAPFAAIADRNASES